MDITLTKDQKNILNEACLTFGTPNQISIIAEELQELSIACLKLTRYGFIPRGIEELYARVLDELADVYIVIEYIENIFGIQKDDLLERIEKKINRIDRWLKSGEGLEVSMTDREVI